MICKDCVYMFRKVCRLSDESCEDSRDEDDTCEDYKKKE